MVKIRTNLCYLAVEIKQNFIFSLNLYVKNDQQY
jgi:hypothetical protein